MRASYAAGTLPMRLTNRERSIVTIWLMFTTEAFGRDPVPFGRRTFPGAAASARFDVITTAITVEIALRLNESADTTRTGRRQPGSDRAALPGRPTRSTRELPRRLPHALTPDDYQSASASTRSAAASTAGSGAV